MTASPATTLGEHALTNVERNIVSDLFILARERRKRSRSFSRPVRPIFEEAGIGEDFAT